MTDLKKETEILELLPEYRPTQKQLDRVMQNWRLILDPDEKFSNKELCEVIDNDIPCLTVIAFFVVNSCVRGLKDIENESEKKELVTLIGKKMSDLKDEVVLRDITGKIYNLLCCPVAFWKNEGFMQIWCELLEISVGMYEKERIAQNPTSKVEESPTIQ